MRILVTLSLFFGLSISSSLASAMTVSIHSGGTSQITIRPGSVYPVAYSATGAESCTLSYIPDDESPHAYVAYPLPGSASGTFSSSLTGKYNLSCASAPAGTLNRIAVTKELLIQYPAASVDMLSSGATKLWIEKGKSYPVAYKASGGESCVLAFNPISTSTLPAASYALPGTTNGSFWSSETGSYDLSCSLDGRITYRSIHIQHGYPMTTVKSAAAANLAKGSTALAAVKVSAASAKDSFNSNYQAAVGRTDTRAPILAGVSKALSEQAEAIRIASETTGATLSSDESCVKDSASTEERARRCADAVDGRAAALEAMRVLNASAEQLQGVIRTALSGMK